ncbi:DUF4882 family protein [Acinetobacter baumannii]|uniref:DUF4882 family protein n=1 Tax=Acinetobacter baumannii TaxID=470 RepID=UPI0002BC5970|nr:DUF4882 family protein [Acinetobacter baumannii]EHU3238956.1 DUF4882 family protein [Acinetobacter baumannii]EJB8462271.1 DUF4882 family protein [Acinetobacter baumannii]EJB8478001.1 DUF4882 family protein [Acinetobacter baumannii]EJB8552573.1 DUF4882 family protein [Acinetobacter baumannii]EJB8569881.1 DUF4882 family protein [Acinetobacter baumannii]
MKKIGIVAVGAITLCWAMYEVSSDNTNMTPYNESSQKVASKNISSTTKNEKLAPQMLLTQTNSLNSTPVCKYNFDATQEDYDLLNTQDPDRPPMKIFPLINGQKFGFKVEPVTEDNYGYLDYNAKSKAKVNSTSYEGDFLLPNKGIVAFEMELKVPTLSSSSSSYSADISFNGVTDNNYTIRSNYHFDIGAHDFEFGENPPRLYHSVSSEVGDYELIDSYFKNKQMTDNTNEYQRLGVYINQDTNQVGFISNGVDEGYQSTLPAPLENIRFFVSSDISIDAEQLFGQELSNELITDRNALQFNYPQGTTDICGNAI